MERRDLEALAHEWLEEVRFLFKPFLVEGGGLGIENNRRCGAAKSRVANLEIHQHSPHFFQQRQGAAKSGLSLGMGLFEKVLRRNADMQACVISSERSGVNHN